MTGKAKGVDHIINETRSYVDDTGRPTQTQSKDYRTGKVWATETLYDDYGRAAITTLPAPTGKDYLEYLNNFVQTTSGGAYTHSQFDNPVGNAANSLGWWYSEDNNESPWQATTQYPYSRTEYSELTGGARKIAGPGDNFKLGSGHEVATYTMSAGTEIDDLFADENPLCLLVGTTYHSSGSYLSSTICNGTVAGEYIKSIVVDGEMENRWCPSPIEMVMRSPVAWVDANGTESQTFTIYIPSEEYKDIHITKANTTVNISWSPSGSASYDVYNLEDDQVEISNGSSSSSFFH